MAVSIAYCLLPIACLDTEGHRGTEDRRGTANAGCRLHVVSFR
jgi:hypothetical protein